MTKVVLSTTRWQTVCWAVIQNCVRNAFICVSYLTRTSWNIRIPILYYIIFRGHSFIHEHVWFCRFYVICLIFYPFSLNTKFISSGWHHYIRVMLNIHGRTSPVNRQLLIFFSSSFAFMDIYVYVNQHLRNIGQHMYMHISIVNSANQTMKLVTISKKI